MMNVNNLSPSETIPGKIQAHHRNRRAIVYVRQSTLQQVERHQESTRLQYALVDKAVTFGWPKECVEVIDDDLGRSGADASGRPGFQRLVAEVGLDHVGLILGIDMSRLARSCRDWHQLLETCSLFRTLIADTEGVYDPGNYNDRLLLGLKGTLSEAELYTIKQRMLAGKRAKAQRGELNMQLPMGYIRHPNGEALKDPDEQVQTTVSLVFSLFERYRTINGVLTHLVQHHIFMPQRVRTGPNKGDLEWRRPNRTSLSNTLHHPTYAGAYVYGRRPTDPRRKQAGRPSTGRLSPDRKDWAVLLWGKLPAYISREDYERNQRQLQMNTTQAIGVPRHGPSLLSGILICGRCGLRMATLYSNQGQRLRYCCHRGKVDYGEARCQSLMGSPLDRLVEQYLLAAVQPAALEASFQTVEQLQQERGAQLKLWQQRMERAQYTSERAFRQYNAVEPENRLVARHLEQQWEEALSAETQLKQDYEDYIQQQPAVLTAQEQQAIRSLASDLPALWSAPTTTQAQRQQAVRLLIERVIVTVSGNTEQVHATIHWFGDQKTKAVFSRPVAKLEQLSYYRELMERAAQLHQDQLTLKAIAEVLNQEGWQTAKQRGTFSAGMVQTLLARKGVVSGKAKPSAQVVRQPDELTMRELAEATHIPEPTLYRWIQKGLMNARKDTTMPRQGLWLIKADEQEIERLVEYWKRPKEWIYESRVQKVD